MTDLIMPLTLVVMILKLVNEVARIANYFIQRKKDKRKVLDWKTKGGGCDLTRGSLDGHQLYEQ